MGLFDVLKYPISSPPKSEELEALPSALYLLWIHSSEWRSISDSNDREHVADWYQRNWSRMQAHPGGYERDLQDLETLKRLIRDYEEPT